MSLVDRQHLATHATGKYKMTGQMLKAFDKEVKTIKKCCGKQYYGVHDCDAITSGAIKQQ